jgi:hypothetical protein
MLAGTPIHDSIVFRVRPFALSLLLALALPSLPLPLAPAGVAWAAARRAPRRRPATVVRSTRIAVQPIEGRDGPRLRARVAEILRHRGFRVVTSLAPVSGTAQYPGLAREHDIAAFVVGGIEERRSRHAVTFLVWTGHDGSVKDRWSVAAPPRELAGAVSRGFWPRLGRSLASVQAPPTKRITPARTMHIDAGDERDEPIVSDGNFFRRRLPVRD